MNNGTTIIPALKYIDAPAAIEWLCRVFSFKQHLVVPGDKGKIAHAQLVYNNAMIMLGSTGNGELDKYLKSPGELRGINTQCIYLVVEDIDVHSNKTKAAGAKIILDIKDEDYGGRSYTCQDLEGVLWSFGTYNPWKSPA